MLTTDFVNLGKLIALTLYSLHTQENLYKATYSAHTILTLHLGKPLQSNLQRSHYTQSTPRKTPTKQLTVLTLYSLHT